MCPDLLSHYMFDWGKVKVGDPYKNKYGNVVQKKSTSLPTIRDWTKTMNTRANNALVKSDDIIPESSLEEKLNDLDPRQRLWYHDTLRKMGYAEVEGKDGRKKMECDRDAFLHTLAALAEVAITIATKKTIPVKTKKP